MRYSNLREIDDMPIITFKTLDELPEELRGSAKEKADKSGFEVNLSLTSKVDEFRERNVNVSRDLDTLRAYSEKVKAIVGDDVEAFNASLTALREVEQRVKDGKLQGSEAIEAEIVKRTETMRTELSGQVATKANEAATWKTKYEDLDRQHRMSKLDSAVNALCHDPVYGVNPQAIPDVLARARSVYEVGGDGSFTPKRNGEVIRGEDGVSPLSLNEWIKGLQKEAEYYFKRSTGGGAAGDAGNGGEAKFGGLSAEEFNKLKPMERLRIANRAGQK